MEALQKAVRFRQLDFLYLAIQFLIPISFQPIMPCTGTWTYLALVRINYIFWFVTYPLLIRTKCNVGAPCMGGAQEGNGVTIL